MNKLFLALTINVENALNGHGLTFRPAQRRRALDGTAPTGSII